VDSNRSFNSQDFLNDVDYFREDYENQNNGEDFEEHIKQVNLAQLLSLQYL
jgi:hypothetical protein